MKAPNRSNEKAIRTKISMTGFERFVTPVYRRNNGYVMLKVMRLPETVFFEHMYKHRNICFCAVLRVIHDSEKSLY